jgi:Rod binding domain-containing protein
MDLPPILPKSPSPPAPTSPDPERAALETAQAFEAAFLAEMLKHSGVNRTPEATGGGAGEDAFSSFLTGEYSRLLAERGGVGLAEQIFNAIKPNGPAP